MELILLIVVILLLAGLIILILTRNNGQAQNEQLQTALRLQMQENREELNRSIRELRMEMTQTINQSMQQLQDALHKNMITNGELQRQKFDAMARQQEMLLKSTEKRLDDMRLMVEEKLQKTLEDKLSRSFALVSELPFDLAFFHTLIYRGHQNVYWTLFFGLCALGCLRHCGERSAPGIFSALALAVLAELLRTDYGAIGVLLIVVLYITRASRPLQCLFGAVAVCYELPAPLAFLPVSLYNGQRGRCSRAEQWAFYLFYPAHLLRLGLLAHILL